MKKIFTILQLCFFLNGFAQTYNMPATNTTYTTCSGNFYDSGGSSGTYTASETRTVTFCPSTSGAKMKLVFSTFATENNLDYLYIYDGQNTSASLLGTYSGTALVSSTVQASAINTSGCLTFRFVSDNSLNYSGWAASISCILPCQIITSVFNNSTPAPDGNGIIRVCQGQSITFNGSGNFSNSGIGANYSWNFGNGTFANDSTGVVAYTTGGAYSVNMSITDANGCANSNFITKTVHVSVTPSFSLVSVADSLICLGDSTFISGLAMAPPPPIKTSTFVTNAGTFLPDGSGISYSTCMNVNSFNFGQTVTSANDIASICLNLEHSYQGDLSIQIICPNGQTCNLKDYPGGIYNYLGAPLDDPAVGPGIGSDYCFSASGSVLLCNGPTIAGQGTPPYTSIAAGTYSPTQSFSNLIGCPFNGNWCIKVTDNLGSDNGYIFKWGINFNQSNIPANLSFTPAVVSQSWLPNSSITSTQGDTILVKPNVIGSHCYTLSVIDDFNCTHLTTKCITVVDTGVCSSIPTLLVNNALMEKTVKVYPNPNNGLFFTEIPVKSKVYIYNTIGTLIYSDELLVGKNKIDLTNKSKGIYFVFVYTDSGQQVLRIVNQ